MRRRQHVRQLTQRMIGRERLLFKDIQPGARQLARLTRADHRLLIFKPGARGVNQQRARLHVRQRRAVQQMTGALTQHQMNRYHIARPEQRRQ